MSFFLGGGTQVPSGFFWGGLGTPWKINGWNTKIEAWKVTFLFNWVIFRFKMLIFRSVFHSSTRDLKLINRSESGERSS